MTPETVDTDPPVTEPAPSTPSQLEVHAETELRRAGLFDADSDYGGMVGNSVMDLVRAFCGEGHSGGSAGMVLAAFNQVIRHKPLTPLTSDPNEWMNVAESLWQNVRQSSCFSEDGGKTYYDIDADDNRRIRHSVDPSAANQAAPEPVNEEKSTAATAVIADQPPPVPNVVDRPIWECVIEMCEKWAGPNPVDERVIADMRARDRLGRERYGTPLQPNNGRNHLVDAYQEMLDGIAYIANEIAFRGEELDTMQTVLGDMLWRQIATATTLRELIDAANPPRPADS